MNHKSTLIAHPDPDFSLRMKRILADFSCDVEVCADADFSPDQIQGSRYQFVLAHEDVVMADGRNISQFFLNHAAKVPVLIFSDEINSRKAVEAIKKGAHDYFTKDSEEQAVKIALGRVLNPSSGNIRPATESKSKNRIKTIINCSDKMEKLLTIARRVAGSNASVLIEGESGTGKELLARFIHQNSGRADKPFVAMNCAALPENLAESELFGYDKGAFTGATKNRSGKFEQAHGGTLVLDEISEMPLSLQVKLLRVLQEKEVDHIGGRKPIPVDVRIVATCNRELTQMVKEGTFRRDLYYRLRVIPLRIPALRERRDDISLLVAHFIEKFSALHHAPHIKVSAEAMNQLTSWSWPGNVRELENTIERAILICDAPEIAPEHLLIEEEISAPDIDGMKDLVGMTVKEIEKKLIGQTLKHVNENRTHAAQMLGISIRTLRNKLREYAQTGEPDLRPASGNNA